MIHHGQGLALRFETRDHLPGIHSQLDDFQGNAAPHWLVLLGDVDNSAATFAYFLQQPVAADRLANGLVIRVDQAGFGRFATRPWRRTVKEIASLLISLKKLLHLLAQGGVANAHFIKVRGALIAGQLARCIENIRCTRGGFWHKFASHYPSMVVRNRSK